MGVFVPLVAIQAKSRPVPFEIIALDGFLAYCLT